MHLQHHKTSKKKDKLKELKGQHIKDTHVFNEQLRRCQNQLRAAPQTIKGNNKNLVKEQNKAMQNEETITQMKELLANKDVEARDKRLRE